MVKHEDADDDDSSSSSSGNSSSSNSSYSSSEEDEGMEPQHDTNDKNDQYLDDDDEEPVDWDCERITPEQIRHELDRWGMVVIRGNRHTRALAKRMLETSMDEWAKKVTTCVMSAYFVSRCLPARLSCDTVIQNISIHTHDILQYTGLTPGPGEVYHGA